MKKYCLGFIFNKTLEKVLLVHKLRPAWQKGKINGIGGKVEPHETSLEAIVREVEEESGLNINKDLWIRVGSLKSANWMVDVFTSSYQGKISDAKILEEEKNYWHEIDNLPNAIISNLSWLIPFSLDKLQDKELLTLQVTYDKSI